MSSRRTLLLAGSLAVLLLLALAAPMGGIQAQTATPAEATTPSGATSPTAATTPGTPTPTRTPTVTPSPTSTLTSLESRLVLAQAFLEGRDFERAAELFAQIAEEDRGNPEALEGLTAALAGKAAIEATIMAPPPTETPVPTPSPVTFRSSLLESLQEIGATALAVLLVLVALYFLAHFIRWLLGALRELWYMRILPLFRRPAVPPGYLIGEFRNTLGGAGETAERLTPQALTEKLLAWNQLVSDKQVPIEPAPALQLGPMAWISILWRWWLPPPRGYRIDGLLLRGPGNSYQLNVQRARLAVNSIDRSAAFVTTAATPEEAYAYLAGEAAKWLISPSDMELAGPATKGIRELGGATPATNPSLVFDRTMELLLPVRAQINQGSVDFAEARRRISEAEVLTRQLPSGSPLRQDLEGVVTDLRRSVPGGD